jgi:DNA-binding transcriptional LysR family regulator
LVSPSRRADPLLHDALGAAIDALGYRFRSQLEVGGAEPRDLLPAVAQNLGVAFAPASLTQSPGTSGAVTGRALDPAPAMPDTVVAWCAQAPRQPKPVLATVSEVAREMRAAERRET